MFNARLLVGALCASRVLGALFEAPTEDVLNSTYDFIVIGAGAGGAVMASRLSEDPFVKVLLIEAGGSDYKNVNISVPGRSSTLSRSKFDWNFTTTPQVGLNDRSLVYPRGYVLGGSTAINQMAFCRGTKDDYERWANVTGDEGWSWHNLQPYILKVDRMTIPVDHHNTTGQFNPAIHGKNGNLPISVEGYSLPVDNRIINTSHQVSDQFPFNLDYNSGNTIGISWTQSTVHNGHRVTSATAYLEHALQRRNLDVLVNTYVTKILPVGHQVDKPIMRGVVFAQMPNGTSHVLHATREVILSAGSLKTPHILMLSGIGDPVHLTSMGIKTIVNLPAVGQNLHDHVFLGNAWLVSSNNTLDNLRRNATLASEFLAQWKVNGTGPLGTPTDNLYGWLRVPANSSVFTSLGVDDPSAGPTSAHFELIPSDLFVSKRVSPPVEGHFFSVITVMVSPTSRGNISLASTDPFDAPLINPNILTAPVDLALMRSAIKTARAFVAAPAWSDYIISEYGPFAQAQTDEELDAYIRDNSDTTDHPVGTVAMGKDGEGGLDADLRVKGTLGLRVVDASAFPYIPSAHTQGPVYILAERAAALVRAEL